MNVIILGTYYTVWVEFQRLFEKKIKQTNIIKRPSFGIRLNQRVFLKFFTTAVCKVMIKYLILILRCFNLKKNTLRTVLIFSRTPVMIIDRVLEQ